MVNGKRARHAMVEGQVRPADVTDRRILEAMESVPREAFLPDALRHAAYFDKDLVFATGEVMPAPRVFAKMIQAAQIGSRDVVLDVGCAFGYSSAILSCLAGTVVAVEVRDEAIARATANLADAAVENCAVLQGPLEEGSRLAGPYDAIVVQGGVQMVPEALLAQLRDGGRLVTILLEGAGGECRVTTRVDRAHSVISVFDATAPLLAGFAREPAFSF